MFSISQIDFESQDYDTLVTAGEYARTFDQYQMEQFRWILVIGYEWTLFTNELVIVFHECDIDGIPLDDEPSRQCAKWVNDHVVIDDNVPAEYQFTEISIFDLWSVPA